MSPTAPSNERHPRRGAARLALFLGVAGFAAPLLAGGAVTARRAALATGSPVATRAGLAVLQRDGTAADAAVAVAMVLAVLHPQAGNLGGGGFATYYDAETKGVWVLDFRETAPRDVNRESYAKSPELARTGALAAGVPGTVAGLEALHRRFGKRPWKELVEPAVLLAREGLKVDTELAADLEAAKRDRAVDQFSSTASMYFEDGASRAAVDTVPLANVLSRLADGGAREFYEGDVAKRLVEGLRASGGVLGFRDLREYRPVWRAPIRIRHGAYELYTVPPPSGGGLVIGEVLGILRSDDLAASGAQTVASTHLLAEAARRAYIDRNRYLADPSTARIPYRELLSERRASAWRGTIALDRATPTASLGEPSEILPEGEHTTHFSIVDSEGNAVALTTTLGEPFGSGLVAPGLGFFLNNAMQDFTTLPGRAGSDGLVQGRANSVDPQKRAASSLAPTIVTREGRLFLALGSRGGAAIPTTVLQVYLNVAVHHMELPEAVAAPRIHHQGLPEDIFYERERMAHETVDALNAMGHGVAPRDAIGEVHAVLVEEDMLTAVADPRRGGAAGGF